MATGTLSLVEPLTTPYDRERLEDVGFMTCMTLVLLGNYAQTGHFGGPLAYTPYNVATHLAGPISVDCASTTVVKHPYSDKFMLAGGHCIPTCYALWMLMGQALARKYEATGNKRTHRSARRDSPDRCARFPARCRRDDDAAEGPRARRSSALRAGEAAWDSCPCWTCREHRCHQRRQRRAVWNRHRDRGRQDCVLGRHGCGYRRKVIAFEGEFAMTEGHAQELKTQALALKVGKRLRVMFSDNNAGIDDALIGGVIDRKCDGYRLIDQWTSGWNVFVVQDGNAYDQIVAALKTMEHWDPADRRPMIAIGKTTKGYWPAAVDRKIPDFGDQVVGYEPSCR